MHFGTFILIIRYSNEFDDKKFDSPFEKIKLTSTSDLCL